MTISPKILNDLVGLAQGYADHIGLCDALIAEGSTVLLGDNLAPAESKAAHLGYVQELEVLIAAQGAQTIVTVADEVLATPAPAAVKQDGAD